MQCSAKVSQCRSGRFAREEEEGNRGDEGEGGEKFSGREMIHFWLGPLYFFCCDRYTWGGTVLFFGWDRSTFFGWERSAFGWGRSTFGWDRSTFFLGGTVPLSGGTILLFVWNHGSIGL